MKLIQIYRMLCGLYGISHPLDIEPFLLTCETTHHGTSIGNRVSHRESLFVKESNGAYEIGLFIHPDILSCVEKGSPLRCLDELGCVVEGASHFLFLTERMGSKRPVSLLELELQGEIDKFLVSHLLADEENGYVDYSMFVKQFGDYRLDPDLSGEEQVRYTTASRFAAKFCSDLRHNYFNPLKYHALLDEVRPFFFSPWSDKMSSLIP